MADLLLELFSEEIPARMQPAAAAQLRAAFEALLADAGLSAERIEAHATPRRLALLAWGLPAASAATREERRGPRADAADAAIAGFLKSTGLTREQLEPRDDPKGRFLYASIAREGRATAELLAERLPALIGGFQWPKSMRWGAASASTASPRWVRPLRRIMALLDGDVVPFEALGVSSGRETFGHRFMSAGAIDVRSPNTYAAQLREAYVIVDAAERMATIREGATAVAAAAGLVLVPDEGLVAENAGLTEWPVALLGRFDPAFLTVPPEVIQLTMRTNQKYFAVAHSPPQGPAASRRDDVTVAPPPQGEVASRSDDGGGIADGGSPRGPLHHAAHGPPPPVGEDQLAPAFVCVANIVAADGGARIVAGNERVLSARLADARFFWERDLAVPLESLAPKLDRIVFHAKLGSVADKVERVAKLARWLIESGAIKPPVTPATAGVTGEVERLARMAEDAARLAKCDLVTGTVGEFPEVQGIAGGYLARAQGEPAEVADAIRDHYKPVGQGDEVPTAPVTVAVALADKLDTLVSFYTINERPTGSRDPFALRRAALGIIQIILEIRLRLPLLIFLEIASDIIENQQPKLLELTDNPSASARLIRMNESWSRTSFQLLEFFGERLVAQQRDAGTRHDVIDAVFALGDDDLVRLLARVHALQAFVGTGDGANLLGGYKRASNILKKEGHPPSAVIPANAGTQQGGAGGAVGGERLGSRVRGNDDVLVGEEGLEPAERALADALAAARPAVAAAVAAEDFAGAMRALATLRGPVDAFFDQVKVNADDPAVRARRLDLLAAVRDAMHEVADFSKIEG